MSQIIHTNCHTEVSHIVITNCSLDEVVGVIVIIVAVVAVVALVHLLRQEALACLAQPDDASCQLL